MENSRNPSHLGSKGYVIVLVVGLITSLGFSMVYTIVSAYAVDIGSTLSTAGLVSGIFSISALVLRPFSGLLSDRYNKRRSSCFPLWPSRLLFSVIQFPPTSLS